MTLYYLDPSRGDDGADGTAPDRPWRTLARAAAAPLGPGDGLRLARGGAFRRQALHLRGRDGAPDAPITIAGYGDPSLPAPAIHCDGAGVWFEDYGAPIGGSPHRNRGEVSTALLLVDCSYVEARGLEITNRSHDDPDAPPDNARDAMDRTGVAVVAQDRGTVRHIVLEELDVHDVDGNVYDKHMANGGIQIVAHMPSDAARADGPIARFDDVRVLRNTVRRTTRWGIAVGYTAYLNVIDHGRRDERGAWTNEFDYGDGTIDDGLIARYGATNVLVEGNVVEDAGGDAITVMYCARPLVRRNVSRRAARWIRDDVYTATANDRVAAAIWPWRCKDALFEGNEAYDTLNADRGNGDGQAWDADYGDGTVYRGNYSHGNSGGAVMFCNEKAVRSLFTRNVSDRDRMGAIDIPRNPDATIRDNVFILEGDAHPLRLDRADGTAVVEGNVFVHVGPRPLRTDWHPAGSHVVYAHNAYLGFADAPSEDDAGDLPVNDMDN